MHLRKIITSLYLIVLLTPLTTETKASNEDHLFLSSPPEIHHNCMYFLEYKENLNLRLVCKKLRDAQPTFQQLIDGPLENNETVLPDFPRSSYHTLRNFFKSFNHSISAMEAILQNLLADHKIDRAYVIGSIANLSSFLNHPPYLAEGFSAEIDSAQSLNTYLDKSFDVLGRARAYKLVSCMGKMIDFPCENQVQLLGKAAHIFSSHQCSFSFFPFLFQLSYPSLMCDILPDVYSTHGYLLDHHIQGQLRKAAPVYAPSSGMNRGITRKKHFKAVGRTLEDFCKYDLNEHCPPNINIDIIHMFQYLMTGKIGQAQDLWEKFPELCHDGPLAILSARAVKTLGLPEVESRDCAAFSKAALGRLLKMPLSNVHINYLFDCLHDMNYPVDMVPHVDKIVFNSAKEVISYPDLEEDWLTDAFYFYLQVNQPAKAQSILKYSLEQVQALDGEDDDPDLDLRELWTPLIISSSFFDPDQADELLNTHLFKEKPSAYELISGISTRLLMSQGDEIPETVLWACETLSQHPELLKLNPVNLEWGEDSEDSAIFEACNTLYLVKPFQGIAFKKMKHALQAVREFKDDWTISDLSYFMSFNGLKFFNPVHVLNGTVLDETITGYLDCELKRFQKDKKEYLSIKSKMPQ